MLAAQSHHVEGETEGGGEHGLDKDAEAVFKSCEQLGVAHQVIQHCRKAYLKLISGMDSAFESCK